MNTRARIALRLALRAAPALPLALFWRFPTLAARWRNGVSLPALEALHRWTARIPFPAAEPAALLLAAAAIAMPVAALIRRRPSLLLRVLEGALLLGGLLALLWAPVCLAASEPRLSAPQAGELEALCRRLIADLNAAPKLPFPAEEILARAPDVAGPPGRVVKAARYPEWMRALRVSGMFVPLTGEAVVDVSAPAALLPFTAVHELMHLCGVADEGAANIAAWQRCMAAGGAFADSARLWALRYAMGMLKSADGGAERRARGMMSEALGTLYRASGGNIAPGRPGSYGTLVHWLTNAQT